jgi:tRNA pseudouridine55 synthase
MNGILIVDKPKGLTSAEVVRRVKGRTRRKVGHLGTLDPFATGVLPVCVGEATKIAQFLNSADKSYEGVIRLGTATDSGDATGAVTRDAPVPNLDQRMIDEMTERFIGDILQKPPMYSALKRDGVPLYKLARQGIEVERTPRRIRIHDLRLELADEATLRFRVDCSKGTYIRVLAEDLGGDLGTVAHVETLCRTRFGPFRLQQAGPVRCLESASESDLIGVRQALAHLPSCSLDQRAAEAARCGQAWVLAAMEGVGEAELATLVDPDDEVAAVVVRKGGQWRFGRVLQLPSASV